MAQGSREFVDGLCAGGPYPALARTRAVIRLEVTDRPSGQGWTLVVADGLIRESDDDVEADCVLRADAATLEGLASGRVNATAAILRGVLQADGAPEVLAAIQGLLPGPPGSTGPRRPAGGGSP
jgi:hypothetical protein